MFNSQLINTVAILGSILEIENERRQNHFFEASRIYPVDPQPGRAKSKNRTTWKYSLDKISNRSLSDTPTNVSAQQGCEPC
jgi:hypothetical protein